MFQVKRQKAKINKLIEQLTKILIMIEAELSFSDSDLNDNRVFTDVVKHGIEEFIYYQEKVMKKSRQQNKNRQADRLGDFKYSLVNL